MSTTTVVSTGRRPSVSPLKQILRLTRTEFTLFVRYKTAWMFLFLPLLFAFLTLQMPTTSAAGSVWRRWSCSA